MSYCQGCADSERRIAELEGKLFRARDAVAAAGQREAWLVEVLVHAEAWMSGDGCDCGTDEPGTCALCEARAIISSPRSAVAQALTRLVEAAEEARDKIFAPSPDLDWSDAEPDYELEILRDRVDEWRAARTGRGEGE